MAGHRPYKELRDSIGTVIHCPCCGNEYRCRMVSVDILNATRARLREVEAELKDLKKSLDK